MRLSLQARVTFVMVLVVTAVVVGQNVYALHTENREREDATLHHLRMVTAMQAQALGGPLWDFNTGQMTAILGALAQEPSFVQAAVIGSDGKIAVQKTAAQAGDASGSAAAPRNAWTVEAPAVFEDGARRETVGTLRAVYSRRALVDAWWRQVIRGAGATAIAASITLVSVLMVLRVLMRPLKDLTVAMDHLAAGDTATTIPAIERVDEVGLMARAVDVFRRSMLGADKLASEQAAARAERSRRQDAMDRSTEAFGRSVSEVMAKLAGAADGVRTAAGATIAASTAVQQAAETTSDDAGTSSDNLIAAAAAVEELTASFGEVTRQVDVATEVSREAVRRGDASRETIQGLGEATDRIGGVVKLIDAIAAQTNLLALNATIEAARAGDAGKGFAVVANEVKALATQTARATADIAAQIDMVRGATQASMAAMTEIGGMIGRLDEVSAAMASAVSRQTETTREIAGKVGAVAGAITQSAQAIRHVATIADEALSANQGILSGATGIGQEATVLRAAVEQFLGTLHADSEERRRFERAA